MQGHNSPGGHKRCGQSVVGLTPLPRVGLISRLKHTFPSQLPSCFGRIFSPFWPQSIWQSLRYDYQTFEFCRLPEMTKRMREMEKKRNGTTWRCLGGNIGFPTNQVALGLIRNPHRTNVFSGGTVRNAGFAQKPWNSLMAWLGEKRKTEFS